MRNKSPLVLMEQLIMVLVFALAAALCMQVFAFSDRISVRNEETDRAVLLCQNTAELLKVSGRDGGDTETVLVKAAQHLSGLYTQDSFTVYYDEDWRQVEDPSLCDYLLRAEALPSPVPGLCRACVRTERAEHADAPLFELTVAWQEVGVHE